MCFTIFQNEKTPFQPIKKRSSKSRKIEIFPKGLTHGFGQKMAIFPCLFFRQYRPGKCVLQYSRKPLFPSRISIKIYFKAYFFRKTNNGKIYNFFSLLTKTVLVTTKFTRKITLNLLMKWLLGSNLSRNIYQIRLFSNISKSQGTDKCYHPS